MIENNSKIKFQRVVMEVFGGCNYTCQMCPQTSPGRGSNFTRKMPLTQFKNILDQIVPKYGKPQINLEGSGEPTMAKDLPLYIEEVKKRNLIAKDLLTKKYKPRIVRAKKGKGSFKRKKS